MSTSPNFNLLIISVCCFLVLNLFNTSTLMPKLVILSLNSLYCCSANTVVGAKYATCFPPIIALKAALIATSVFPYPTSPQRSLSIGLACSISFLVSSIHLNWSSVSVYGKLSSNCLCHSVSLEKAYPFTFCLFAYNSINSLATSLKLDLTLVFVFSHSFPPNLFSLGKASPPPTYFLILSKLLVGTYKISSFLYLIFI